MSSLFSSAPRHTWKDQLMSLIRAFSPAEQWFFYALLIVAIVSASVLVVRLNAFSLIEVPSRGGTLTEGVIGSPRFINPLLAVSDSDRDLTQLVYSGLMRATEDGTLVPDLASDYSISEDGLIYTFTIKENAVFHDGTPVTPEDVMYTVALTQDPVIKSPRRASWDGVITQKIDDQTVAFVLPQPYAPFLNNTTIGILPKHLWEHVSVEQFPFSNLNIEPIGSGPFYVSSVKQNDSGLPTRYELKPFKDFVLGRPYLSRLTFIFYPSEETLIDGFNSGDIDSLNSISPQNVGQLDLKGARVETHPLPRIFGVFFNQNHAPVLANQSVRDALALAAPKEQIIEEVLGGYGRMIDGPIPPGLLQESGVEVEKTQDERLAEAQALLASKGWERNDDGILVRETNDGTEMLSFTITTSNAAELKRIAEILKESWQALGAQVETKFFETSDLNQNVIRSREYDALLFGEIIGRELDLFSFWHSSQRNDPGLNIALYTNIAADGILARARESIDPSERETLYREFETEVQKETPAVFLYSPLFIYVVPEDLKDLKLSPVTVAGERFLNVYEWYLETERIWPFMESYQ